MIHVFVSEWQKISYFADWCHVIHPQKTVLSCYNYGGPVNDIISLNLFVWNQSETMLYLLRLTLDLRIYNFTFS